MGLGRRSCFHIALALALLAAAAPALGLQVTKQLAAGVTLYQEIVTDTASPLVINAVTVDAADASVSIRAAIGSDAIHTEHWAKGRETVSELTARKNALLGVNADFFPFTGDPLGVCIADGELISEPANNRVAFALLRSRGMFFDNPGMEAKLTLPSGVGRQIDGINRGRETNQLVAYTRAFGASTRTTHKGTEVVLQSADLPVRSGKTIECTVAEVRVDAANTPIPDGGMVLSAGGPAAWFLKENLKPGDTLSVRFEIRSASGCDWNLVEQAVGGGPWLLKNGSEFIDFADEGFGAAFSALRHPRTALGITSEGRLLIVTVDGRQTISGGVSLPELSRLMKRLGAVDAINLDGGGSTTLAARGMLINSPSGGEERPVANALLVFAPEPAVEPLPGLSISGIDPEAISGRGTQLFLTWGDDAQMLTPDQLSGVVWGSTNGVGIVNQMGYFTPIKARKGTVNALYGGRMVSREVSVVAGPPAKLDLELTPDPKDASRSQAKGTVQDTNSNRVGGCEVTIAVTGGRAEPPSVITGKNGEFAAAIVWDASAGERKVRAAAGDVSAEAGPAAKK